MPQVDRVVLVDNGSNNLNDIRVLLQEMPGQTELIPLGRNEGIAAALNQAVHCCEKNGAVWLLTLDQDSVIPADMVFNYRKYIGLEHVGQLSCVFFDPTYEKEIQEKADAFSRADPAREYAEVDACITSGCLMSVPVCRETGYFDERLFIDDVDHDYSFRMRRKGYKIYQISAVTMEHHLGRGRQKRLLFYHYIDYQYSPMRVYYQARNGVYMIRAYPEHRSIFCKTLIHSVGTALLGGRFPAVGAFFRGVRDGVRMEVLRDEK